MTANEAESILFEGMNQTDNSIVEFYKHIAQTRGYSLKVFFDELYNAYQRIEKYINSYEVTEDIFLDENGNEFKYKNTIKINTDSIIDCDNVGYLCRGLDEIAKELLAKEVINVLPKFPPANQKTGFTCNLPPETVKEIYFLMAGKYLSGDLNDFQAIFANTPTLVKNPVKWLIKSQKKPCRGHQTKLYLFIETMLNGKFSAKDKRKAVDLFIDEKGKFFNSKMKEPNENDRNTHNIFETLIKGAKEKTRLV